MVIDAKSGVSGAGREPSHGTHFVTVDETVTPYKVGAHRHTPEIEQELGGVARDLHARTSSRSPTASWCRATSPRAVDADVRALYDEAYARRAVGRGRRRAAGHAGGARDELLPHLGPRRRAPRRLIVFATIDNLWKGTSSQAIQNLNLMFGLDETEGLAA